MPDAIRMVQVKDDVALLVNGKLVAQMPWQVALQVSRALAGVARKAEEHAKAGLIVEDQALLLRSGIPLGLSDNRLILKEAYRRAEHMPGLPSIDKPPAVFGAPKILNPGPQA